jgi:hypothetical protein
MRAACLAAAAAFALAAPAFACDFTEDDWNALRRMVVRVKIKPHVEAWAERKASERVQVRYLLSLDEPVRRDGRCWWPVEVSADGEPWRRFLVRPDSSEVVEDDAPRERR